MTTVLAFTRESNMGFKLRRLRLACLMTRNQLAEMAGVSAEDIDIFEHNMPLPLDTRRKILQQLLALYNKRQPLL